VLEMPYLCHGSCFQWGLTWCRGRAFGDRRKMLKPSGGMHRSDSASSMAMAPHTPSLTRTFRPISGPCPHAGAYTL
jgi:hypothetical protein